MVVMLVMAVVRVANVIVVGVQYLSVCLVVGMVVVVVLVELWWWWRGWKIYFRRRHTLTVADALYDLEEKNFPSVLG